MKLDETVMRRGKEVFKKKKKKEEQESREEVNMRLRSHVVSPPPSSGTSLR
jgi:hypothetical protein